jgi:hypothetical protein
MVSSGFSATAERAHRNQGRLPFFLVLGQRAYSNHAHGRGNHHINLVMPFIATSQGIEVAGSSLTVEFHVIRLHDLYGRI